MGRMIQPGGARLHYLRSNCFPAAECGIMREGKGESIQKEVLEFTMQSLRTSTFLRRVLFADAATCVATGLLLTLGPGLFEQFTGLPAALLRYAGLSLLPFAALLVYLATRESVSPMAVWTVVLLNALWTLDSFLLLLTGWVVPTEPGYAFVVAQALAVAVFAGLEYFGLRRAATAAAVAA